MRSAITMLVLAATACSSDPTGPSPSSEAGHLLGAWSYSADFRVAMTGSTDSLRCTIANARLAITGPLRPDDATKGWPYWADGTISAGSLACSSGQIPAFTTPVNGVPISSWRAILAAGIRFMVTTPVGPIAINNNSCPCFTGSRDMLELDRIDGTMSATHGSSSFSPILRNGTFTARRID